MLQMKQFESGEEFIFDGITKIPIFGIAYGVPRSLAYASMGNKKQMMNSIRGVAENGAGVLKLIATPLTAPIGKLGCDKYFAISSTCLQCNFLHNKK